jgi:serine/threonine-protein kinase
MATVHLGRLVGPGGFAHTVAIKRLHAEYARSPDFVAMFLDEARLASRIHHANVVRIFEVFLDQGELLLVMEFVRGETLARLISLSREQQETVPLPIALAIVIGALWGLHAAHEATDESDAPLGIVHRDVSPQNVLVGVDGVPRLLDFGVAKAAAQLHTTRTGEIKGKVGYMAPEQIQSRGVDRRSDVYAMGVVAWEALTGRRLFSGDSDAAILYKILEHDVLEPGRAGAQTSAELDRAILRALSTDPSHRFDSAREFALALEEAGPVANPRQVGEWVARVARDSLAQRAAGILELERADAQTDALGAEPRWGSNREAPIIPSEGVPNAPPPTVTEKARPLRRRLVAATVLVGCAVLGLWWIARGPKQVTPANAVVDHRLESVLARPAKADRVAAAPVSAPNASAITAPPIAPLSATASAAPAAARTVLRAPRPKLKGCDPPFELLANGVKRYKPHCL